MEKVLNSELFNNCWNRFYFKSVISTKDCLKLFYMFGFLHSGFQLLDLLRWLLGDGEGGGWASKWKKTLQLLHILMSLMSCATVLSSFEKKCSMYLLQFFSTKVLFFPCIFFGPLKCQSLFYKSKDVCFVIKFHYK